MDTPSELLAINQRLTVALDSARQVAFDWLIAEDQLYFSEGLAEYFKGVLVDTSKVWSSSILPAIIHDDDKENFRAHLHRTLKGVNNADSAIYRVELRLRDASRGWRWVDISARVVERDSNGRALRMVGAFCDIDERKQAEQLQLDQNRILNMVATGAELSNILEEIALLIEAHSNRGQCSILLLDPDGTTLSNGIAPSLPDAYRHDINGLLVAPSSGSCGTAIFRAEPVIVTDIASDPLWATCRNLALRHGLKACSSWPIFGKNRTILGTVALYFRESIAPTAKELQLFNICTDLAGIAIDSRASEEKIRYLAHYDGLTSLPNRFLFKEFLDLALRNAQRHGEKFAVFFLDLDKFKDINDTFGHEAGDQVLRETANRLRGCLRQTDKIARMGGDEFYILIEDLHDGRYAAEVAQKLLTEASRPIRVGRHECQLSVSIGIGIYPDDGRNGQSLLRNADNAMYRAKNLGKNGYQFFSAGQQCEAV